MSRRELNACFTCRFSPADRRRSVFPYMFSRVVAKFLFLTVLLHSSFDYSSAFNTIISCTQADRKRLQRVTNTAQNIIGCPLSPLSTIYNSRCLGRAKSIIKDYTHPGFHLFNLLPSGRRYRTISAKTNRPKDSFFPRAVTILNSSLH